MIETAYEKNVVFYFSIAEPKVLKGAYHNHDACIDFIFIFNLEHDLNRNVLAFFC